MTKSRIRGITVKAVEEEGTADLNAWAMEATPNVNTDNPFMGEIKALFHTDTYRCVYEYRGGNSYTTSEVELSPGELHEFQEKSLKSPETYPFKSCIVAQHKINADFWSDSRLCIYSNSADQYEGNTGVPWLFRIDRVYKATEGSLQTIDWDIVNYGVAANIYVDLWDNTDSIVLDRMDYWAWVEPYATYGDSFTFTFHSDHTLMLTTYYWYNEQTNFYEEYIWHTK